MAHERGGGDTSGGECGPGDPDVDKTHLASLGPRDQPPLGQCQRGGEIREDDHGVRASGGGIEAGGYVQLDDGSTLATGPARQLRDPPVQGARK